MNAILPILGNASLWRGLVTLLMGFGIQLDPDQINAILSGGLALHGLIHAGSVLYPLVRGKGAK